MRLISIDKVHFGHVLYGNIFNMEGQCLFTAGLKLESHVLDRLVAMKFKHLLISDAPDMGVDAKPLISEGLRLAALKMMHKIFRSLRGNTDVATAPDLDMKAVFETCNAMVDEIAMSQRGRVIDIPTVKSPEDLAAEHAVQTAVLSAYVGCRLGYNMMILRDLVVGAILHDIGECFLPEKIVNKEGKFTADDFIIMQQHTVMGFKYLSRFSDIKATSRAVTIQHHERFSGKGYPKGMAGTQIHPYSGVVGACEIFDAMTSDRPFQIRHPAIVALGLLLSSKDPLFAPDLREIFPHLFAPFQIGTWVTLSDGRIGLVKSVPKETPTRPDVKVLYDALGAGIPATVVRLSQDPGIRIAGIPSEF